VTQGTDSDNATYVQETLKLSLPANMSLVSNPPRDLYAQFGIGELGLASLFDSSMFAKVGELRKKGIKNTLTIGVSRFFLSATRF
jgi:hypothetical protein